MMKVNSGFLERIRRKVKRRRDHRKRGGQLSSEITDLERQSSAESNLAVEQSQLEDTITQSNPGPAQQPQELQQSGRLREEDLCSNGSYSRGTFLAPSTADASKTTRRCSLPTVRVFQLNSPASPVSSCDPTFLSISPSTREDLGPSLGIIDTYRHECSGSHTSTNLAVKDLYMLSATDSGLYSEEECSASEEEYLDVFSDEDGEEKEEDEEEEEDGVIIGDGWVIPAQEVSLDKMVVSNNCETIYR